MQQLSGSDTNSAGRSLAIARLFSLDMVKKVLDLAPLPVTEALVNHVMLPQLNTAVSNVRGPQGPLYLAAAGLPAVTAPEFTNTKTRQAARKRGKRKVA